MMMSLLQNPANGGTPAADNVAMTDVVDVTGIKDPKPEILSISLVCVCASTAAALTNKSDLKIA